MKKFYMFIFVFVVSLFIPKMVFASNLTDDEKIAIALYQEAVREGYTIDVPESLRGNSFYNAMQPLVNILKGSVQSVNDVFEFVGDTLVYDVNKVKGWLTDLFGSDRDLVSGGSYFLIPSNYNIALSSALNRGLITQESYDFLLRHKYVYNSSKGYVFCCTSSFIPANSDLFLSTTASYSFSNGTFNFSSTYLEFYNSTYSANGSYYFSNNNPTSISSGSLAQFPSYSVTTSDLNIAISNYLSFLQTLTNFPCRVYVGNVPYYINYSDDSFSMSYQGNPSTDIDITQSAIQETYFNNNTYNEVTNIYNSTTINNINNGGDTDIDIDIDIPFDIDINGSISSLTSLPGIFENVSSGDLSLIHDDSESKEVFTGIFSGLPIEITTLFVTVFILLVVVGVINRLLG